ncbi:hypothetical protein PNP59_04210 [Halobacterium salinarum]|jgi:hypothetical protein|uniref:hypothetical protein n=1 Tax=Halobacterium TaxID=2239 RepID=UPI0025579D8D|nr:hypothetical protein [Halobacterium salinarum]MDL0125597.1 hypothetical protein [Halobacterium salinarum]MDL0130141.1 hypothetical protein [Halobacterium salinarum]
MILDAWDRPQRLAGGIAMLLAAGLLGNLGGVAGVLFGGAAIGAWLVGPPVFAFVISQAGVAAISPVQFSIPIAGMELALLVVLLSDSTVPWTATSRGGAALCAILGGALIWVGQHLPTWQLALAVLAVATLCIYGVHRYELLTTNQLNHE